MVLKLQSENLNTQRLINIKNQLVCTPDSKFKMNGEFIENSELPINFKNSIQINKKMIVKNHLI